MKRFFTMLLILLGGGALVFGVFYQVLEDQRLSDSGALFGGELERGYPSAGYLISYETGGGLKTCGYAALNDRIAVTASHCVDNSTDIYLGLQDFSLDRNNQVEVTRATQREGWIQNQDRTQDFAILEFNPNESIFSSYAQVASPREGCDFRVVAYGRTEDPNESFEKPRKSALMCASDVRNDIFFIQGDTAGICFGDSGSPVFYEGTNQLVGMVASIVLENPNNTSQPCAIGNKAIVVRADANQSLINERITLAGDPTLTGISVTDGLTIEIASDTFLERIGLGELESLTEEQRIQVALFGTIGLLIIVIIAIILTLLQGPRKQQNLWE